MKPSKGTYQVLIVLLLFVVISLAYFPSVLKGDKLVASDLKHWEGMAKEIKDFRKATGDEPLWTNSMFGGMPSFQITAKYKGSITAPILKIFNSIPQPINYLFVSFALFFVLSLLLGANIWIGFAGALAYGFATFIFVLIDAGHVSKVQTLSFLSLLVSGIYLAYNKKAVLGSLIAAIGLAFMINANHPQITYYAGILTLIIAITYFIYAVKEKTTLPFFKSSGLLVAAAILAVGLNFGNLYSTYEYGKYSTRGKSDLKLNDANQTSGLDRDYILDYSYDLGEAMTAFIPRFKGGSMSEPVGENSETYKLLEKSQGKEQAKQIAQNLPLYWGSQPISGGTFYFGAVLCFLFVLGLFIVKGKEKWWIVAAVVVAFLLSLGKNLPFLANFMIDHFPMYNKFRDVKNIIVIQHFAMAVMGVLALKEIYLRTIDDKKFINSLKYAFAITGGLSLLFALIPGLAGSFNGASDAQLVQSGWPQQLIDAIIADRRMVLRADAFRTFLFVALAAAGLWAFWKNKLKAQYALILWVLLVLADLWPVNKRYFNEESFAPARKAEVAYLPTPADEAILKDKDLDYRVLNMGTSTFQDVSTSYFHKSIGGYHGAKLKRYQELIENSLSKEMQELGNRFKTLQSEEAMNMLFVGMNAINMLNTRYLIYNPKAAPLVNQQALGNAWFTPSLKMVANANEELKALETTDVATTAIIDKQFDKLLTSKSFVADPSATIRLKSYAPNKLVYQSNTSQEQLAVFSEIYYPKGWEAKIDGKSTPHFRSNYVLRSMVIPAGSHEIVFEFKPKSYTLGNNVSFASSLLLLLAIAGFIFIELKKSKKLTIDGK